MIVSAFRDRELVGTKMIARALGVSERTVSRMIARGSLEAKKLNGQTSPWRVRRDAVAAARREKD